VVIRDAAARDLAPIMDIMNYYRIHTTHNWDRRLLTAADMKVWFSEHKHPPYAALVAEEEGRVLGYASLSRFRLQSGYALTAENSIYLAPGQAGRGVGRALMLALLERAQENGLRVVTAWIDSGNQHSVRFHENLGFYHAGLLKNVGLLDGHPASVIIMQYDVP